MRNRIKKLAALSLALLVSAASGMAAITQTGYIKTRGRLGDNGQVIPGKRLAAATVVLQNGSSVVSDQSGNFNLTLPSNRFYLKNVKKAGYVISDPDMLSKEYVYSQNPLVLVLDEPTVQQDDKLASERQLRRNLQRQLQQREDELEALKEASKITQEQYREALQKLYKDQESNEKFISELAERYSKIDFDQLDDFQRRLAAFIQNGELARADSLLRTKGSMVERKNEILRLQNANNEEEEGLAGRDKNLSDSKKTEGVLSSKYASDCYNHFEICKLRFENDSAAYWLERRAELMPDNLAYQHEAGQFIHTFLAKYDLALQYFSTSLGLAEEEYGETHPLVASIYNNIGVAYHDQGNYFLALENLEKALKINLETFGRDEPYPTRDCDNAGSAYSGMAEQPTILENFDKALKIWLEISDKTHPDVAISPMEILDVKHPFVATSYHNIGSTYYSMGAQPRALEYFEQALKIRQSMFGEFHPEMASSYNNIGVAYLCQGNYHRSLDNFEQALKIQLETFGENHPHLAAIYANIGFAYSSQRDYSQALENFERALKIRLEIFGNDHPQVMILKERIGNLKAEMKGSKQ